jgi:hypothetical protein
MYNILKSNTVCESTIFNETSNNGKIVDLSKATDNDDDKYYGDWRDYNIMRVPRSMRNNVMMGVPGDMRDIIQGKVVQIAYGCYNDGVVVLLNDGTVAGWHPDLSSFYDDIMHRTRRIPEEIRAHFDDD